MIKKLGKWISDNVKILIICVAVLLLVGGLCYRIFAPRLDYDVIEKGDYKASVGTDYVISFHDDPYIDYRRIDLDYVTERADVIVRAKRDGSRTYHSSTTVTEVKILEYYFNDTGTEKDHLKVVEPVYVDYYKGKYTLRAYNGYNLINDSDEYVLFLSRVKDTDLYRVSGLMFGKYDISQKKDPELIGYDEKFKAKDLRDKEIITGSTMLLNNYISYKAQVMAKYIH